MKNKLMMVVLAAVVMTGCSSVRIRTKYTDPAHRVMILPSSITEESYNQIMASMMDSNKFIIVDRGRGFKALKKEQTMIHKEEGDRFDNAEKYSRYGKLYGVGAVIVASQNCQKIPGVWTQIKRTDCRQYMSAIDTSTGEVITSVQRLEEGESMMVNPTWDNTVEAFNERFPKTWDNKEYDHDMKKPSSTSQQKFIRKNQRVVRMMVMI